MTRFSALFLALAVALYALRALALESEESLADSLAWQLLKIF